MVLVTGCTGFIGRHLVNTLVDRDFEVKCIIRGRKSQSRLPDERVALVPGDITRLESLLAAAEGADTIIHLVGIIREKGGATFERIHIEGTQNVLDAARILGVRRIIYMSALGAREDGASRYQTSKWQAEELVRSSGLEWIVIRPSVVIGNGGFVKVLLNLVGKPVIPVIGSGEYKLQPLYIGDLTQSIAKMLRDSLHWENTYELGGPEQLPFSRILDLTCGILGIRKRRVHLSVPFARRMARIMESVLPNPPITSDELAMLQEDNITEHNALVSIFGVKPTSFSEALRLSL